MTYQYQTQALNMKEGLFFYGCFDSREKAQEFVTRKRKEGCINTVVCTKPGGEMPYGEWQQPFDTEKYLQENRDWYGDGQ